MRRALTAVLFATAAVVTAVAIFVAFTLPRRADRLTTPVPPNVVFGAYHIHSNRSDGTGTVDEIAAAAARAGLQFVILTDHGDATRPPDPPAYRHGVLCLDAAEISTFDGHLVAMHLRQPSPYPLAGEGRDVAEDVARLGGWVVVAHPDSPKEALRWRAMSVPFGGIEWVNADSEWRDDTRLRLLAVFARSIVRPAESMVSLFARPARSLQRWDTALRARPVVGLAAVDAHANIGWSQDEEPRHVTALARPSYESMFRVLAQAVMLDGALSGDAAADAERVWGALGSGRTFSITRAIATPAVLVFEATRDGATWPMGSTIDSVPPPALRASVPGVSDVRLVLVRDGQQVLSGQGSLAVPAAAPGVYRVEAYYPRASFPWLMSAAIRVEGATTALGPGGTGASDGVATKFLALGPETSRHVEPDPGSTGSTASFDVAGQSVRFAFKLAPGAPAGQYAALASDLSTDAGVDRVTFTARANRPMRLVLEVRMPPKSARWRRSFYVDETPRTHTILVRDLEPVDGPTSLRPIAARLQAVLVVVNTLNTTPGTDGVVWLTDMKLGVVDRIRDQ